MFQRPKKRIASLRLDSDERRECVFHGFNSDGKLLIEWEDGKIKTYLPREIAFHPSVKDQHVYELESSWGLKN